MRRYAGKEERYYGLKLGGSQITVAFKDKVRTLETSMRHKKPLGRSHTPLVSQVQLSGRLAASRSGGREIHYCGQGWALR